MAIIFFKKSLIISTWQSYFERFHFLTLSYTEKSQYSAVIVEFVPLTECFMKKIFLRINVSHKKTSFDNYAKTEEKWYGGGWGVCI